MLFIDRHEHVVRNVTDGSARVCRARYSFFASELYYTAAVLYTRYHSIHNEAYTLAASSRAVQ